MSDVLNFEFGQPQEVAIKFTEPKVFDGTYGERCMYSLTDGRVMYHDPLTVARIKSLGITPGELFFITKHKRGRLTEWEVSREQPAPAKTGLGTFGGHKKTFKPLPDLVATVAARNGGGSNLEEQLQASIDMVQRRKLEAKLNAEAEAMAPAATVQRPQTKLEDALKTVVAAAHAAQEYARSIGFASMPQFTSEDIRTMANTLMIQHGQQQRAA